MGRLPFEQLDLLVIGEIGKNYSGAGIDPNVVGRLLIECEAETEPLITRICCLDLSPGPWQWHWLRYRRSDPPSSC